MGSITLVLAGKETGSSDAFTTMKCMMVDLFSVSGYLS